MDYKIVRLLDSGDGLVRIMSDYPKHSPYERNREDLFVFGRYLARWTS
nr:hypothetical protein [Pararhizobium sp. IMCC3301]